MKYLMILRKLKKMITTHDISQGTDEWLQLRQGLYTGSNADRLLSYFNQIKIVDGVSSSYSIAEITGIKGNFYTKRGHLLEDEAIEVYETITGDHVDRPGFVTNTDFPNCGYSPDGIRSNLQFDLVVEVKCFKESSHMKIFNGVIPLKVLAQIHFGMLITGKKLAHLLIYNPDFAKKILNDVPNPNYDPKKAFKIIPIKYNRDIANNFKRILNSERITV